ncbi:hypothetical protein GCM10019059_37780 [Camelimonas fluminis]|uniref:Transposase n=1 Tax=Camelimonas fluminis TaxID=1576911 RepID=A0ABV7UQ09_9HYPH|nr:hypothetical protein [Camelimonas fluminis]GHE74693.1 hypothetical protein GCM10019059_37780 [Camelimonas fluminis]
MKSARIGGNPHRLRERAYMPTGDQLDAIAKGFRALLEQGFSLPDETRAWVENCEAVKARLPKTPPKAG